MKKVLVVAMLIFCRMINKKQIKYLIFAFLFCVSSFLCYSQNDQDCDVFREGFRKPNVLKISVQIKDHGKIYAIEEYFICPKYIYTSKNKVKLQLTAYIYIYNYRANTTKYNIDTLIVLDEIQKKELENFCNFICENKIPNEYKERQIYIMAGEQTTYTMEIAEEKYTFTDRKHLSLAILLLGSVP